MMSTVWKALHGEITTYLRARGLEVESITFVEEREDSIFEVTEVGVQFQTPEGSIAHWVFEGTPYEFIEEMVAVEAGRRVPCL